MPIGERKYSDEQRDAVVEHYVDAPPDRRMTAAAVVRAAKAGTLTLGGRALPAFELPSSMVSHIGRQRRAARAGHGRKARDKPENMAPRDAVETFRRRLCRVLDEVVTRVERDATRAPTDAKTLAAIGQSLKLVRELQSIPGPDEPRQVRPGSRAQGAPAGERPRSAMAESALRAAAQGTSGQSWQAAPRPHREVETMAENTDSRAATDADVDAMEDDTAPKLRSLGSELRAHLANTQ